MRIVLLPVGKIERKEDRMDSSFYLSSNSLTPGGTVPKTFLYDGLGCDGGNVSPHLHWEGAPPGTKSFAITVFDPDARTSHGWWHWAVVNIPKDVDTIDEGASRNGKLPEAARELMTDFDEATYGGPCPPSRDRPHRYIFTVHALRSETLPIDSSTTAEALKKHLERDELSRASFTVKYGRN